MTALDCRTQRRQPGREESLRLLATHSFSRVTIAVNGSPMIFYVHHHVVDFDTIVFRGERVSEYTDTNNGVSIMLEAEGIDDGDPLGWYVRINGVARDVVDPVELARLRELVPEPPGSGPNTHWIQLRPETILGRRYIA